MKLRVGIPRSLFYYYYYPGLEIFFKELGAEVILSPETNKKIFENGLKRAVDDICLPFKAFFGHVYFLADKVDYIFVPRLISLGPKNYFCPKFMGLPDMLNAAFSTNELPQLLSPDIDLRKGIFPLQHTAYELGKKFNVSLSKTEFALWRAIRRQKKFTKLKRAGNNVLESLNLINNSENNESKEKKANNYLIIAVLGHAYLIYDNFLSLNILKFLKKYKVNILTQENINRTKVEKSAVKKNKKLFWYFNRQLLGAANYFLYNHRQKIDGIILVDAFGCGPDSMVNELVNLSCKKQHISLLDLNLDEHSGQAGIQTRLEAFVDLLQRRKIQ